MHPIPKHTPLIPFVTTIFLSFLFSSAVPADQPLYEKVRKANKLYKEGKYGDALNIYTDAQIDAPTSDVLQFNIGAAQYRKGDYQSAEKAFEQVLNSTKDLLVEAEAAYNLGDTCYRQGKLTEALKWFKYAIGKTNVENEPDIPNRKAILKLRKDAQYNYEFVQRKIKEMMDKNKKTQQKLRQQQKKQKSKSSSSKDQKAQKNQKKNQQNQQNKKNQVPQSQKQQQKNRQKLQASEEKQAKAQKAQQGQKSQKGAKPMTRAEALRLLQALEQDEKERRKQRKLPVQNFQVDKDW